MYTEDDTKKWKRPLITTRDLRPSFLSRMTMNRLFHQQYTAHGPDARCVLHLTELAQAHPPRA